MFRGPINLLSRADRGELAAVCTIGVVLGALLSGVILLGVPIADLASFLIAFATLVLLVLLLPREWRSGEIRRSAPSLTKGSSKRAETVTPPAATAPLRGARDPERPRTPAGPQQPRRLPYATRHADSHPAALDVDVGTGEAPIQDLSRADWVLRPVCALQLSGPDARYSSSLERGLRIMSLFTEDRPTWRLVDVAAELGYSRSTTHRYLTTLVNLGQLVQTSARRYSQPTSRTMPARPADVGTDG